MAKLRQPLFLARASYRKRRLRDGARLLPIFGLGMLLLPMMWPQNGQDVTRHWAYIFAVWAGLIAVAAALTRGLGEAEVKPDAPLLDEGKIAARAAAKAD